MEFSAWQQQQKEKDDEIDSKPKRNKRQGQKAHQAYIGAPYNFVPFYDKVYEYPDGKLTNHNDMKNDLVTGEIIYEIKAETPVIIDDGAGDFFRDARGRYAIPGSTVRGLIRNNVQVLGLASYCDDIDDYALMYRDIIHEKESSPLEVYAGYVANEGGKYVIYKTVQNEQNYYVLSERKIINDYLKYGDKFSYGFWKNDGKNILQHEFQEFKKDGKHYIGEKNKKYKPYYLPVSYEVAHGKDITAVGTPGKYKNKGFAVSTGKMNEKKAVYIIPEIDKTKEGILIPGEDVRAFKIDLKRRENTLGNFGGADCFDLPKEGKTRPVFYSWKDGRICFGFTPNLRVFYRHTLKEGLKPGHKTGGIDYAKALFGYTFLETSYKSKLSFSDAVLVKDKGIGKEQKRILAEPKPTSCLDYLEQDEGGSVIVTYDIDGFKLRGAKQYWLHESLAAEEKFENQKVASTICPLREGAKFTGKIRFQNLTEDELGLLLWAARLNEGSQMNIGKAKAYGYGRISVNILQARKIDLRRAYETDGGLCLDPFLDIDVDKMVGIYKKTINQYLGGRTIDQLPHIIDFFMMKDSKKIPADRDIRYMKIGNKKKGDKNEYQSRKKPLPKISAVANKK